MTLYNTEFILKDLNHHIQNKLPFSILRFGDGGIKFIHAVLHNEYDQLKAICDREGIPFDRVNDIINLWTKYANDANYIDIPDIYYTDQFWGKYKNKGKY